MRFQTLNLRTKNVNLVKDVGLIPYYLHALFDVDSTIVTYKNDESYPYLSDEVLGLKAKFIKKRFGRQIDGMLYVLKNAKDIDVLNIYHLNMATFFSELAYRLMNKKGKIYLKLDMSMKGIKSALSKSPVGIIKRLDIKLADVVSVETKKVQDILQKYFGDKIIYITNGCLLPDDDTDTKVNSENTILTVCNFGTWEKASDTLLNAFIKSAGKHDYTLKIIGSVDEKFKPFIDDLLDKNPMYRDRIVFLGEIHDRKKLLCEYKKAKVFTLPSRQESFGIVLVEAAYEGCFLITTDAVAAGFDLSDNGKYGAVCKTDDADDLADKFVRICTDKDYDWQAHAKEISEYAKSVFNWEKIITKLYYVIK